MIRGLIKLGTLALAGYAVYSIYDMVAHRACQSDTSDPARSAAGTRANPIPDFGTTVGGARLTGEHAGGGTGMSEKSLDATGTMASHRVGRGVL